jgi:hydrogenase maturation protease
MNILIAGIGNIFLGDDGFGVEVVQRLARKPLPDHVRVIDFGIRGFDLAYALLDNPYDLTVLVDATAQGGTPGMLYTIEPDFSKLDTVDGAEISPASIETHGMNPMRVFQLVKSMGGQFKRVVILGCEPETLGPENEGQLGLSDTVQAAVDEAVRLLERLIHREGAEISVPLR